MFRLVKTVGVIIGYAALATTKLNEMDRKKDLLPTVNAQDKYISLMAKKWAGRILDSAGVIVEVSGDNQNDPQPVLFISNHEGNFDIPVLVHAIERPFGFVSKIEVKKIPFLDDWMMLLNSIYLDRSNRRSSLQMIKDGVASLKAGHNLLIFPEGHRSKGQGLQDFKAGGLKIAKSAGVDIVPIAISGTSDIMEKYNSRRMVPGHVKVQLLEPIPASVFKEHSLDEVGQIVRERIAHALES
ncbi:1-acyl-sn-glycerol-3-phosphate acyltransferase [Macrococcus hajekii]|uniref:1-acyl-sn-glycerol-3-phosphate acyltransferase n=1 Tax=Macrococcus hajekii TaxID=198482 RepID=A0A4R6BMW6_9STAP|nr:lysophospholipid acyltransferase family protein [Macrococcus hajekii]TDM03032.1 1-acyl-sn-glycerol-3-phosphate acyltransferase [Macrococcus hajekii]GGB06030.1 1-acyl-sn-glycerol-3-phosphate acyltransferase [Macrococcus hajekii]